MEKLEEIMILQKKSTKRQSVALPLSETVKAATRQALAAFKLYMLRMTLYWEILPKPHRIGILVLIGILIMLLL
ncbi:OapA N-terminal domain-containing protein [Candidatus Enterovibrio altilux]|uniref:OapA N-terminal domain-containing protein n=1 Tax=Candidatus Enterovibrio altilux TaxID=1927128 RepID=UPI000BBC2B83